MRIARQLSQARLPLEHCFGEAARRAEEDRSLLAPVYGDIRARLSEGLSPGTAIAPYAGPEEVMLIDAAQTAGSASLAGGFQRAARLLARRREIRGLVLRELLHPLALLLAVAGFLAVTSLVLIPKLAALSDPSGWSGCAAFLHGLSAFAVSWKGLALVPLLAGLSLAAGLSLPRWTGPGRDLADRLPPWSLYRLVTGVCWLHATATLLQTRDLKLGVILRRLLDSPATTPYLRWRLRPLLDAENQGCPLGEALCLSGSRWPDRDLAEDLRLSSRLPGFRDLLPGMADDLLTESVERVRAGARLAGGLALFALTALCLVLAAGLFGIQESVSASLGAF